MSFISKSPKALLMLAMLTAPAAPSLAQTFPGEDGVLATVEADRLPRRAEMSEGPEIEGIISARAGDKMQITTSNGTRTVVAIDDETEIESRGGFLGLGTKDRDASSLFNGLPVSVKTLQYAGVLLADEIKFKNSDLKTASMIFNGTDQRFAEQTAATEALRGRMGDIDQYNIKGTTNVYFDTGKWKLTGGAENQLCSTAARAEAMDNALLLVVGYTDSVGDQDYNQILSEKRAGRVVNYLQQACGWKPYRMLTPTGMAEADPAADNDTEEGKAQNRRVAVNILVSKGLDGL